MPEQRSENRLFGGGGNWGGDIVSPELLLTTDMLVWEMENKK